MFFGSILFDFDILWCRGGCMGGCIRFATGTLLWFVLVPYAMDAL